MKRISWNSDWKFSKQGEERQQIMLPHDAMLREGRMQDASSGSGGAFHVGGVYEYEKNFIVPEEWSDCDIFLELEGVMPHAEVLLNGKKIDSCEYGYRGFCVQMKDLLIGKENCIKVIADGSQLPNSRWYCGAGIYRPVWLWIGGKKHIAHDRIKVHTIDIDPAIIHVDTVHTGGDINIEILYHGDVVATGAGESVDIPVPDAKLWSDETPELYQCRVKLLDEGIIVDEETVSFGIRTISWSSEGLLVNGKRTLLRGGCIHHDNGILGAVSYDESEWRRIRILKETGFNAIRSAHNPAGRAVLEACDYYGMYVMDEAWDMWYNPKNANDYSRFFRENYVTDLRAMVNKDYNHPSVIMYSIGNELSEPAKSEGIAMAKKMVDILHEIDSTRAVTAGTNLMILLLNSMGGEMPKEPPNEGEKDPNPFHISAMDSTKYNEMVSELGQKMNLAAMTDGADKVTTPFLDTLDIAGYNYASGRYPNEGRLHPDRIVVGSETFPQELYANWEMVKKYPYLIGDFMWTAWDYLGEVGLGSWSYESDAMSFYKGYPWLLAESGIYDILGHETAEVGMTSVIWGNRKTPYIGVVPANHPGVKVSKSMWRGSNALPYWSYANCSGNETEVEVYSDAHSVALYLNDEKVGESILSECKAVFPVSYMPGTLTAVAYDAQGNITGQHTLRSAQGKTGIKICPNNASKNTELVYVDILLTGENGEVECNADIELSINVEGGKLLGFGSANPRTEESFLSGKYKTYYGRSQAVIYPTRNKVTVTVSGSCLDTVSKSIEV